AGKGERGRLDEVERIQGEVRGDFGLLVFFFFQAEDGIRDLIVTGVQTCALPISASTATPAAGHGSSRVSSRTPSTRVSARLSMRSEERRVGKECRSRWALEH